MNLYHWNMVEAMQRYTAGDIIVMAETVEEARQKTPALADAWLKEHKSWWFFPDGRLDTEYWQSEYDTFHRQFREDLAKEPVIVEGGVIFIEGSE